jgi:hypothetical protein
MKGYNKIFEEKAGTFLTQLKTTSTRFSMDAMKIMLTPSDPRE